jgi:hypothetical protein
MNALDLDEAQGLTPDLLRQRLEERGHAELKCQNYPICPMIGGHTHHGTAQQDFITPDVWDTGQRRGLVICSIELLAALAGVTDQDLLRQINPRLRKGVPSEAAQSDHARKGGVWIAARGELGDGGTICFISFYGDDGLEHSGPFALWDGIEWRDTDWGDGYDLTEWSFWPCDEHGQRVRWPERDGAPLW